ncbi:hypothetical protein A9Q84_15990 [Halobacteriovorax marinus]|uniref:histidine kinase n=1 Tax=Halobacteriovorax marinus TaxID=97084 RepID=A0A1Y5F454_9BACT|nr:hypothetical protein A9Q84_15990 [Halobacteriovorax marinus]
MNIFKTLKYKFLFIFIAIISITLSGLYLLDDLSKQRMTKLNQKRELELALEVIRREFNSTIKDPLLTSVQYLSKSPVIFSYIDSAKKEKRYYRKNVESFFLNIIKSNNTLIKSISLANENGKKSISIVGNKRYRHSETSLGDSSIFLNYIDKNLTMDLKQNSHIQNYISNLKAHTDNPGYFTLGISINEPLYNTFVGLLTITFDITQFLDYIKEFEFRHENIFYAFNSNFIILQKGYSDNAVINAKHIPKSPIVNKLSITESNNLLLGLLPLNLYDNSKKSMLIVATRFDPQLLEDTNENFDNNVLILALISCLLIFIVTIIFNRNVISPIIKLSKYFEDYVSQNRTSDLPCPIVSTSSDEIGILNQSLVKMTLGLDNLQQTRDIYEKNLSDKISQSTKQIADERKLLRTVIDADPTLIFAKNRDGKIIFANHSFASLYQETVENIEGLYLRDFHPQIQEIDKFLETDKEVIENQVEIYIPELCLTRHDKSKIWLEIIKVPVSLTDNEQCVLIIAVDITQSHKNEVLLTKAKIEAERISYLKTQFVANMSHEIRTPLNSIVGFGKILLTMAKEYGLEKDALKYVNNIVSSSIHLKSLVDQTLDLSKLESSGKDLIIEEISIKKLIEPVYEVVSQVARTKKVTFTCDYDSNQDSLITTDVTKLRQTLINLIHNAIKFTTKGREVKLSITTEDKYIIFKIIDQGIGIAKTEMSDIFMPFHQLDDSLTKGHEGAGLGLALCKKLIEALQGEIWVESELNIGSQFTIKLPQSICSNENVTKVENKDYIPLNDPFLKKGQIALIIDDHPLNQEMLKVTLNMFGLVVHQAYRVKEGITEIKHRKPDIIFMDLHMPDLDGFEGIQLIRKMEGFKKIPIVLVTANVLSETKEKAFQLGVEDFLEKPIDHQKLKVILEKKLVML